MDWDALIGGLIGAGVPAIMVYLGLHRQRQSADAEAFGPAVLLLDRLNPDRVMINAGPDDAAEAAKWQDLQHQLDVARERLLVVSAGNPRRHVRELARAAEVKLATAFQRSSWAVRDLRTNTDNPEWVAEARRTHAAAVAAVEALIEANFGWRIFGRRPQIILASATGKVRRRQPRSRDNARRSGSRPRSHRAKPDAKLLP
jgi:hypothetical protein